MFIWAHLSRPRSNEVLSANLKITTPIGTSYCAHESNLASRCNDERLIHATWV